MVWCAQHCQCLRDLRNAALREPRLANPRYKYCYPRSSSHSYHPIASGYWPMTFSLVTDWSEWSPESEHSILYAYGLILSGSSHNLRIPIYDRCSHASRGGALGRNKTKQTETSCTIATDAYCNNQGEDLSYPCKRLTLRNPKWTRYHRFVKFCSRRFELSGPFWQPKRILDVPQRDLHAVW